MSGRLAQVATKMARLLPSPLWKAYGRKAKAQGFDRLYFALSCDCDTPEDAEAAARLHEWLTPRGMKATYAVPGEQLVAAAATYKRLAEDGAAFINHGARPHAEWRNGRYWSITFYHEMSPAQVVDDIKEGDRILREVIGRAPSGFRAPHFGLYQRPEELQTLHGALVGLGYRFSTSTVPALGLRRGPIVPMNGAAGIRTPGMS